MKVQVKPCTTVGDAFMVVKVAKYGKPKVVQIGLTKFEAECLKIRLTKK